MVRLVGEDELSLVKLKVMKRILHGRKGIDRTLKTQ